jgi:hypothetical protein
MNVQIQNGRNVPSTPPIDNVVPLQVRREHRARDFGVGYGSSSGYASERRYTNDWGLTRFRFA